MSPEAPAMAASRPRGVDRAAALCVAIGALSIAAMLLYLCGRPLDTNDMWWHLSMGEAYVSEGPWPDGDPILFTAHAEAPVQQEWGFSVLTHVAAVLGGFPALRVIHLLAAAGILGLVFRRFEAAGASGGSAANEGARLDAWLWAAGATGLWVVLSWWRLFQLRSDLFSIPATLLLAWLAFGPREAGRGVDARRIGLAVLGLWLWANVHSLFGIGLALLLAGLCGALLERILLRVRPPASATPAPTPRAAVVEWMAMLGLGALASALHPRGFAQIATFFTASREFAIWRVRDDWLPFDPFGFGHYGQSSMTFVAWLATDVLLVAFALASATALARFLRDPGGQRLHAFSPVHFGLGLAGCVALVVSVRFIWMAFFPLAYLLRFRALFGADLLATAQRGALAVCTLGLAILFPSLGGFARDAADPGRYLHRGYATDGFAPESVRFLRESHVQGRVLNAYPLGGFMGYWLRPRLTLFIDSRTEHYDVEVVRDYSGANRLRSPRPGETFLGLLDRHRVDLFVGTGLPGPHDRQDWQRYTTRHVDTATGWRPVFRNFEQSVSLRVHPRNATNLARITRFWRADGTPFDPEVGFDAARVVREAPERAVAWRLVPPAFGAWHAALSSEDEPTRIVAMNRVARSWLLLGADTEQVALDRGLVALRPDALAPRRRLVHGLLRLGRAREAVAEARALAALSSAQGDRRFVSVAEEIVALGPLLPGSSIAAQSRMQERNRLLTPLEVVTRREIGAQIRPAQAPAPAVGAQARERTGQ